MIIFLGLLASRRWAQLVSPQVWDEEGLLISGFIHHGWGEFLRPLNGYLVWVPQIIIRVSLAISLYSYPLVSTILTWLFTISVGLAVAIAPTHLKGRFFCAAAIFLVPSDPEVFGLTLYTFWWASVLLFLLPLWDEKKPLLPLRLAFLLAGGLSSPVIVAVLPILWLRAFWYRGFRAEKVLALAGTAVAAVQLHFVIAGSAAAVPRIGSILRNVIPRFCGWFLAGNFSETPVFLWSLGAAVIGLIAAWCLWDRRNLATWTLLALWGGAVALSIARISPEYLNPRAAGPRYFFFPFVLMFWMLIQGYCVAPAGRRRAIVGMVIGCAAINAVPVWSRRNDDLHWADQVRSARCFPSYRIPIQVGGTRFDPWWINESRAAWTKLFNFGLFHSSKQPSEAPTFAYRLLDLVNNAGKEESIAMVKNFGDGAPGQRVNLGDGRAIAISAVLRPNHREFLLNLRRGDRLRFRSSSENERQSMQVVGFEKEFIGSFPPSRDGVWLEFSNSRLPAEFALKIQDDGPGPGLWSALGVGSAGDICVGKNHDGSLEIGVPLTAQPGIATQPRDETSAVGSTVVFTVVGSEFSSYQWKHDNVDLADGTSGGTAIVGATCSQLMLTHLKPAAAGSYVCELTNPLGSVATRAANLSVVGGPHPTPLTNFSFRGWVGAGTGPMIGRFKITGATSRTVLIQALGPGQAGWVREDRLPETSLRLSDSAGPIYGNTGWKSEGNGPLLRAAAQAAFADADLANGDSALLVTLSPGSYATLISGVNGATGVATLEVFQLP